MAEKKKTNNTNSSKSKTPEKTTTTTRKTKVKTDFDDYKSGKKRKVTQDESFDESNEIIRKGELTFQETLHGRKVKDEIVIIISFLLSLLMILSYFDLCGLIGTILNFFLFGLMGVFAYVFPIVFFGFVLFLLANRYNSISRSKVTLCVVIIVCVTSIIHILVAYDDVTFLGSFAEGFKEKRGGGFMGELLSWPLCHLFGKFAAVIIEIVAIMISFMLLTGKALLSIIGKKSKEEYKHLAKKRKEYEENRTKRKYEESMKRTVYRREDYISTNNKGLYSVPVDNSNRNGGEYVPKKSNDSFLKRLKENGGNFDKGKPVEVNDEPEKQEDEKPVDSGLDMVEITGLVNDMPQEEEAVYVSELKKKFGVNDNFDKPTNNKANNTDVTKDNSYDANTVFAKNNNEDNHTPVFADELDKKTDGGNFGMPANKTDSTLSKSSNPDIFARGDYKKVTDNSTVQSHSLNGKQSEVQASPVDDSTSKSFAVKKVKKPARPYQFPPINKLNIKGAGCGNTSQAELRETAKKLQDTLKSFGVNVTVTNISCGPSVTRYELTPEVGVKVSKITSLADDIKLNLAASDIRIEAPIPGKSAVGIEVPNKVNQVVTLGSLINSEEFKASKKNLTFAVGKDIGGQVIIGDISKMPHVLIAGATGSGKSVCINTLIVSILYKAKPEDVKLILIDPKVVELSVYNGIPHLMIPVVTDPKKASGALNWAVMEMTDRYKKFADLGVRDLVGFNKRVETEKDLVSSSGEPYEKLPQIVIVIDELADLMMVAPGEVEEHICRIAQLARAAGIHLVIATQRPSVNVITGLIKANVPSRIAFAVSSQVDSRTIIDMAGAEKLLGKGDMLYSPYGSSKPVRVQGAYVSDEEVLEIIEYIKQHNDNDYDEGVEEMMNTAATESGKSSKGSDSQNQSSGPSNEFDEYLYASGLFIITKNKASIGILQRQFKIGFNRAARIMDQLAEFGVVGPEEGTKPRQILMTAPDFESFAEANGLKN